MEQNLTCESCGMGLPPDAPEGLCPACLLEQGMKSGGLTGEVDPEQATVATPSPGASARPDTSTVSPEEAAAREPDAPPAGARVRYFGDYELLEEIARGGMGVVYKARQVSLNRIVALKMILSAHLAREEEVRRFHVEAEAAANLQHPNIVAIHEVGEHEGQHYFSMDYIEGESLDHLIRENPLPAKKAARYVKTIAEAIHYAHEQGTLHRDLKPSNILIDSSDQPRVTDFGLAKRLEGDSELTASGAILGTPSYMPPEQACGRHDQIDAASDVYALGAILYELLTGRPPFRAETPLDTLMQVVSDEPVPPRLLNSNVPRDLETICLKCLEKSRSRRYASRELGEELGRFLGGEPVRARPISAPARVWRWFRRNPALATRSGIVVVVLLAVLSTGFVVAWRERHWHLRSAIEALDDRQDIRYSAARSLGEMGSRAKEAIPLLLRCVKDHPQYTTRVHAAEALWRIDRHPAAIPALIELQRHDPRVAQSSPGGNQYAWHVRYQAICALQDIGPAAREAIPALIETLAGRVEARIDLREPTARALLAIGLDADAVPLLLDALGRAGENIDHGFEERFSAWDELTGLLERVAPDTPDVVPALVRSIKDKNPGAPLWAARFLLGCGPGDRDAVPRLVDALSEADPDVRSWAACALSKVGAGARAATPALIAALTDDERRVRWRVAMALGAIGPPARAALSALREAANEAELRPVAEWAIQRIQRPSTRERKGM